MIYIVDIKVLLRIHPRSSTGYLYLFICGFYVTFNTVQVISRQVVGKAEETSTYSLSGFYTVNC